MVLNIQPEGKILKPLILRNSFTLKIRQFVTAVRNPYELAASLTAGVISQLNRCLEAIEGRIIPNVI